MQKGKNIYEKIQSAFQKASIVLTVNITFLKFHLIRKGKKNQIKPFLLYKDRIVLKKKKKFFIEKEFLKFLFYSRYHNYIVSLVYKKKAQKLIFY